MAHARLYPNTEDSFRKSQTSIVWYMLLTIRGTIQQLRQVSYEHARSDKVRTYGRYVPTLNGQALSLLGTAGKTISPVTVALHDGCFGMNFLTC
jgi:hypothetical protein